MEIQRNLELVPVLKSKSCFLFGARQTGKTTLIQKLFPNVPIIQLLDPNIQRALLANSNQLEAMITEKDKIVIIDEIQKIPALLDMVHLLIEKKKIHFLMTGSNARKLRQTGVNLLGGRARTRKLLPLTMMELKTHFSLEKAITHGLLPSIYFSDDPFQDLQSYASEYLLQEISAEGATRNVPAFSRFLEVAALCNGLILNYSSIGSDAAVGRGTVQAYFQILEDTLIGHRLPAWKKSKTRKAIGAEKFYFFDPGIVNALLKRKTVSLKSPEMGALFETLIFHELRAWNEYKQKGAELSYWKSTSNFEVDFLIDDEIAIEVKAKENITDRDLKGLRALQEEKRFKKYFLVCLTPHPLQFENIKVVHYREFLEKLWLDLL